MKSTFTHPKGETIFSSAFICGLIVLLANDFYFKANFHNSLTGKVSDIAGLFIFPIFFTHFLGRKKFVFTMTALIFVIWKSDVSQPTIDFWNSLNFYRIGRTVDYSDLLALLILPVSYYYDANFRYALSGNAKSYRTAIVILSSFSFIATAGTTGRIGSFELSDSKANVYQAILRLKKEHPELDVPLSFPKPAEQFTRLDKNLRPVEKKHNTDSLNFKVYLPENADRPVIWFSFSAGNSKWREQNCRILITAVSNKHGNKLIAKNLSSDEQLKIAKVFESEIIDEIKKYLTKK
jgi:hypothetical protein